MARVPNKETARSVVMSWSSYSDNPDYVVSDRILNWENHYGYESGYELLDDEIDSLIEAWEFFEPEFEAPDHVIDLWDKTIEGLENEISKLENVMASNKESNESLEQLSDMVKKMRGLADRILDFDSSDDDYSEDDEDFEDDDY